MKMRETSRGMDKKPYVNNKTKSEITEHFFEILLRKGVIDNPPFIKSLGEGTTDEELFGGVDLELLTTKGITKYNVENSFMNHEIVIFEEMLDAHPSTLLSLKDILTSKMFRNGEQQFKIKTKMIIALTNKSKDEFNTDDSKKAFTDRFQYVHRLEWDNVGIDDYIKLFTLTFGSDEDKSVHYAKIANLIHNHNSTNSIDRISPRTANYIMKAHLAGKSLKFIPGINYELVDKYEKIVIENGNLLEKALNTFENIIATGVKNNILITKINPATPATLTAGSIIRAKLKGETEIKITENFELNQLEKTVESKEYIEHGIRTMEKYIDKLTDEKEKETATLALAKLQLLTIQD